MSAICIDCGCELERGEASPCLCCSVERSKKREAAGRGERICRDCQSVFDAVTTVVAASAAERNMCPECGSVDTEPLSVAQRRAEQRLDGDGRGDYEYDMAKDGGA